MTPCDEPPSSSPASAPSSPSSPRTPPVRRIVSANYPRLVQLARIQGPVTLLCTISDQGGVLGCKPTSGHPLLHPAALASALKWRFLPPQPAASTPAQSPLLSEFILTEPAVRTHPKVEFSSDFPNHARVTSETPCPDHAPCLAVELRQPANQSQPQPAPTQPASPASAPQPALRSAVPPPASPRLRPHRRTRRPAFRVTHGVVEDKVPCRECGALVLPATATRTGGLCVPCQKGTRGQIQESIRRAEELRNRPPTANYWLPLVQQAASQGFPSLTQPQRFCYSIGLLDIEILNGGITQYFSNPAGSYYSETEQALQALGLVECLDILLQAKLAVFGDQPVPGDRAFRTNAVIAAESQPATRRLLDQLSTRYLDVSEQTRLLHRVEQFAVQNQLPSVFPADRERGSLWQAAE